MELIDIRKVLNQKAPHFYKKIPGFLIDYLVKIIHQEELNDIMMRYSDKKGIDFMNSLLEYFDLSLRLHGNMPSYGRFIFASNHPLGGMDGICLSAVVGNKYEGNIRYLVNDLLLYIDNLKSIFVPINKHGVQSRENACAIEESYASDNQIITFPAGLCSRNIKGKIVDLEWKKSFIQKAVQYKRDVIPVYFDGKNSSKFYNIAKLRKFLGIKINYEMIYLPDEMFKAKHKTFDIYFGEPIPWQTFNSMRKAGDWAELIKQKVYQLKNEK